MGLNLSNLKLLVITPALANLGLTSTAAINLVTGTALQESAVTYLEQIGGPALGLWQMEPATEQDIWTNWVPYNLSARAALEKMLAPGPTTSQLVWNLYYGAAMCRIKYYRAPDALPTYNDAQGLATYWKTIYNTSGGAGTVDTATIANFQTAIDT